MIYKVDDIVRDVRIAMDENAVNEQLAGIGDVDTLTLDEIIKSKVTDAVDEVHAVPRAHAVGGLLGLEPLRAATLAVDLQARVLRGYLHVEQA